MVRKTVVTAAAFVGIVGLTTAFAPAAAAATRLNGVCEDGEYCLYWGDNQTGSVFDDVAAYFDMAGLRFVGPGAGQGSFVKNNAASVHQKGRWDLCVYYNENKGHPYDLVLAGERRNLNSAVKNNNASVHGAYSSWPRC